ncbi:MotA/TolQ/ExbB proton channel family protein [bacterium]|nr:MotA/TolQ/ExbB proton channel family protein [bacterium]MCP5462237.1 MotA/TolQ/ExbB proton channel family protein [bacterium]
MSILTNSLFWISSGLLIPVIIALLWCFIWALFMAGSFYGIYMHRLSNGKKFSDLLETLRHTPVQSIVFESELSAENHLSLPLANMKRVRWQSPHADKIIDDYEIAGAKSLESSQTLVRLGPMLGLMGTLIPMGPALVGLAVGNIASMAVNMQVAFSTTVVGIFVGAVGFITHLIKKRWFVEDISHLRYILQLAQHEIGKTCETTANII